MQKKHKKNIYIYIYIYMFVYTNYIVCLVNTFYDIIYIIYIYLSIYIYTII